MKKIKFHYGSDAKRALMKRLVYNFFRDGKITTTETRAKAVKPIIEKLVGKIKVKNEANQNDLLFYFSDRRLVERWYRTVAPVMTKRVGGYVKMEKLTQRFSDGARLVKLWWTDPVVVDAAPEAKTAEVTAAATKSKQ
ncbi:bL17 family ribosomal protein [Patescibacteria group bacterium]|nr:bL17 family ribosomal protein [Patescibacteria group bacterium]MCL5091698.1 bL17 family ribosomal protein [Patescibacteria group bacterium]